MRHARVGSPRLIYVARGDNHLPPKLPTEAMPTTVGFFTGVVRSKKEAEHKASYEALHFSCPESYQGDGQSLCELSLETHPAVQRSSSTPIAGAAPQAVSQVVPHLILWPFVVL
jgi:hypothetical protein